jgi:hypothetical protein
VLDGVRRDNINVVPVGLATAQKKKALSLIKRQLLLNEIGVFRAKVLRGF